MNFKGSIEVPRIVLCSLVFQAFDAEDALAHLTTSQVLTLRKAFGKAFGVWVASGIFPCSYDNNSRTDNVVANGPDDPI